jgi:hypothetical protein
MAKWKKHKIKQIYHKIIHEKTSLESHFLNENLSQDKSEKNQTPAHQKDSRPALKLCRPAPFLPNRETKDGRQCQ